MIITDFSRGNDVFAFTAKANVWGSSVNVDVILDDDTPRNKHTIEKIYPVIEKIVQRVDMIRQKIERALLDDGWIETAEEWASEGKVSKTEQGCYILEDGNKVYLPLTNDDFCDSLFVESVCIYFDEELDANDVSVFLVCTPDYFAGRAIALFLDSDGDIQIKGLEN